MNKKLFFTVLLYINIQLVAKINVCIPEDLLAQAVLLDVMATKLVEEETAICCDNLHSKIDGQVLPELMSIESKLDEWVGPLTETIDSQVDVLEVTVDVFSCQTVNSTLDDIVFPGLQTIESKIDALEIGACSTLKGDIIPNGAYTISTEGVYTLTANTVGCLTINEDRVTVDLQGFTLSCDSGNAVIEVVAGHENIKIINGTLQGAAGLTNDGILVNSNCQLLVFSDLVIRSCNNGINVRGIQSNFVKAANVTRCFLQGCNKGASLEYAKKCIFKYCAALNCIEAGFEQAYSEFNVYEKCKALETANNAADERAIGFSSSGGVGNLYTECVVEGTQKIVESNFGQDAIGFLLTGTLGDMEAETKIINCIANTTSVLLSDTLADAYGIKIEPVLLSGDDLFMEVATEDYVNKDYTVYSVSWSLDGKYLAAVGGYGSDGKIRVYRFDASSSFTLISSIDYGSASIYSVHWSPNGRFLAIGGGKSGNQIQVYSFDGSNLSFTPIDSISYGVGTPTTPSVRSVHWSQDGRYLAVGGTNLSSGNEIQVYSFDGSHLSSAPISSVDYGTSVYSVNWSPDGKYLAIGGATPISGNQIQVYSFDGSHLSSAPISVVPYTTIRSVVWSPNGRYLAVKSPTEIRIYSFDGLLSSSPISSIPFISSTVYPIYWSPDGNYLAVGGDYVFGSEGEVYVYSFDSFNLVFKGSVNYNGYAFSVNWSPNGRYLAVGGYRLTSAEQIKIYSVMDATSNCLIDSNRVCNTGNGNFGGVGILASGENVYIRNIAYGNDTNCNDTVQPRFGNLFGPAFDGVPGRWDNLTI